jgi:hypothetical protein
VRFYKPTEAELDRLGDLSRDEATAWARLAFCGGIVVDVVLGMMFATGLPAASKAFGVAVGLCAFVAGVFFFFDAKQKRKDGKSALDKIKQDHDFANI